MKKAVLFFASLSVLVFFVPSCKQSKKNKKPNSYAQVQIVPGDRVFVERIIPVPRADVEATFLSKIDEYYFVEFDDGFIEHYLQHEVAPANDHIDIDVQAARRISLASYAQFAPDVQIMNLADQYEQIYNRHREGERFDEQEVVHGIENNFLQNQRRIYVLIDADDINRRAQQDLFQAQDWFIDIAEVDDEEENDDDNPVDWLIAVTQYPFDEA